MLYLFDADKQHKGQVIRYLVKVYGAFKQICLTNISSHVLEGAEEAGRRWNLKEWNQQRLQHWRRLLQEKR